MISSRHFILFVKRFGRKIFSIQCVPAFSRSGDVLVKRYLVFLHRLTEIGSGVYCLNNLKGNVSMLIH